ncbi:ribosomal protein S6 [Exophiala xenobiotica]|uniref:Small ribosomal subunit protein bS6m n=1 Tax=Exophiala xenobiotica TaxID=348802 RepID=A0A0D2DBV4_9EURO|nr:ribosomal protein S6 [Exophiala xenobiotica]KIW59787.1 ribosomal protein S6 [Exophiala xenobiotica]
MLYELIAVVRPGNLAQVKEIARICGQQIVDNRGVIRGIKNWGQFDLPRPTVKHQTQHHQGHYFVMQFDGSIKVQTEVRRLLGLDPRMIRFSVVKIGDKLGGVNGAIEEITGHIPWNSNPDNEVPRDTFEDSNVAMPAWLLGRK